MLTCHRPVVQRHPVLPELIPQVVEEVGGPAGRVHRTLASTDAGTQRDNLQVLACGGDGGAGSKFTDCALQVNGLSLGPL